MELNPSQPFRFGHLPLEIRHMIYRILLCSFEHTTTPKPVGRWLRNYDVVDKSINPAILRTNKTVYQEAYEVMVRTNRFVRVTLSPKLFFRRMVDFWEIPIVTANDQYVHQFNGYALSMSILEVDRRPPQFSFILLFRDLDLFCWRLASNPVWRGRPPHRHPGLAMTITIAPLLAEHHIPRRDHSIDFFSETTQQDLLRPFRRVRNLETAEVRGAVSRDIATVIEGGMTQGQWTDPQRVLEDIKAAIKFGEDYSSRRHNGLKRQVWHHIRCDFDRMGLYIFGNVEGKDRQEFLHKLAEQYLIVVLNEKRDTACGRDLTPDIKGFERFASDFAESIKAMMKGPWWITDIFRWRPCGQQKARILYKFATCFEGLGMPLKDILSAILEWLEHTTDDEDTVRGQPYILMFRELLVDGVSKAELERLLSLHESEVDAVQPGKMGLKRSKCRLDTYALLFE